jgi:SAM-dependent methyltransferase
MQKWSKLGYQRWQTGLFEEDWFAKVFVRVMGALARPIYDWAWEIMQADLENAQSIGDVGCGNGLMSRRVASELKGRHFHLVEPSAAQLEAGRSVRETISKEHQVTTHNTMAEDLPIEDKSLDVLYTTGSINLWTDPARGLMQCKRVLKPGGTLWLFDQRPCNTMPLAMDALFRKRVFGLGIPGYPVEKVIAFADQVGLCNPEVIENMSLYGLRWTIEPEAPEEAARRL